MPIEDVLKVKLEMLHSDVVEVKTALNKLSDAITKLALVEQQQNQTAQALERAFKAISKIEDRLTSLEQLAPQSKQVSEWVNRGIVAMAGLVDRKSTRLNSSHIPLSRMPSSA